MNLYLRKTAILCGALLLLFIFLHLILLNPSLFEFTYIVLGNLGINPSLLFFISSFGVLWIIDLIVIVSYIITQQPKGISRVISDTALIVVV
jgi:hypothetical protein